MTVQYAALPYRRSKSHGLEVLLITSRHTGQWIVPKGRPEKGTDAHKVAAIEAMEEAGVRGRIHRKPIGQFKHLKSSRTADAEELDVVVFALLVTKQEREWPEKKHRQAVWLPLKDAAGLATSEGLKEIILSLHV